MSHEDGFIIFWKQPARTAAGSEAGQHMLEYAILIGLVTVAAVAMQFSARLGLQTGVKMVSDVVLGEPPAPKAPDASDPVSTVAVERCDGSTLTATGPDLVVQVRCSDVTEDGDSAFRRITTTKDISRGASVNEDARLQVFEE